MADEPNEQPPAEGDDAAAAEEVSPPAPEAQAEPNEGEAPEEQPAAEEPAPAEAAEEPAPVEAAEEPAPAEVAEEPAAAEAAEEPAPAEAAEEPAPAEAADEPAAAEPAEEPAPVAAAAAPDEPTEAADEEPRRQRPPRRDDDEQTGEETVVPGAHLEPDLVLDESRPAEADFDPYATASDDTPVAEGEEAATVEETAAPATAARTPLELAADARYRATGKRKRAIARVILKPGAGTYTINGKELDVYFPRVTLQKNARLPLQTTGNDSRMDVVAKIHGGGVSSQAIALRHGISRALVEADPSLRTELKRHGFLTRDARVKERKKAGLKKARKRPQFSKR
jgi:small subunit ribosomal protein S9